MPFPGSKEGSIEPSAFTLTIPFLVSVFYLKKNPPKIIFPLTCSKITCTLSFGSSPSPKPASAILNPVSTEPD